MDFDRFQTMKNVSAQDELLFWYDESLAAILGLDPNRDLTKDGLLRLSHVMLVVLL